MKLDWFFSTILLLEICNATQEKTLRDHDLQRRYVRESISRTRQNPRIVRRGTGDSPKKPSKPGKALSSPRDKSPGAAGQRQASPKDRTKGSKPIVPPLNLRKHIPGLAGPEAGFRQNKGTQTGTSLERSHSGLSWTSSSSAGKSPQYVPQTIRGSPNRSPWTSPFMDFSSKGGFMTKHGDTSTSTPGSSKEEWRSRSPSPQRDVDMTFPESVMFRPGGPIKHKKQD